MEFKGIFFLILIIWIISIAGAGWQLFQYKNSLNKFQSKYSEGYLGVGMSKTRLKPKKIILLITDNNGVIQECEIMSGLTIFARFKEYKPWKGCFYDAIPENLIKSNYKEPLEEAVYLINRKKNG